MKRVGEAIAAVDLVSELFLHCLKRGYADVRRKHQRPSRRARHNAAVNVFGAWRSTPGFVAFLAVRAGDAPDIFRVTRKLLCQVVAELPVRTCSSDRVFEPVDFGQTFFPAIPKIDPNIRVLMDEEWRRAADVRVLGISDGWARPGIPRVDG